MGGNALKHCTERINKEEYLDYKANIIADLGMLFLNCYVSSPPELKSKESFGDIDILVESYHLPNDWQDQIISQYNLTDDTFAKNGNCFSFKYKKAQVDLILVSSDDYLSSYTYFSYNDLWNLIGRIGHKLGVKVGHDGLYIIIRPEKQTNHIVGDICLSKNLLDILNILGLSKSKYNSGFSTPEDLYEYVSESKYFNPDIFLLDNRNATSRIRDKKRKVYSDFLVWIEINRSKLKNNYQYESVDERGGYSIREPYFSDIIIPYFGVGVKEEVDHIIAEYELNKKYKELFDGKDIGEVTGYSGPALGRLISEMKSIFPDKSNTIRLCNKNWMSQFAGFLVENPPECFNE